MIKSIFKEALDTPDLPQYFEIENNKFVELKITRSSSSNLDHPLTLNIHGHRRFLSSSWCYSIIIFQRTMFSMPNEQIFSFNSNFDFYLATNFIRWRHSDRYAHGSYLTTYLSHREYLYLFESKRFSVGIVTKIEFTNSETARVHLWSYYYNCFQFA